MENNNILNNLEAIRNEIGNNPAQQRIDEIFNYCIEQLQNQNNMMRQN